MGRFRKEFNYSLKMKKHWFFLILVWLIASCAVWMFSLTLEEDLAASFPQDYGKSGSTTEKLYKVAGTEDEMVQVLDSSIKAEMAFNSELHAADWMDYSEVAREDVYIRSYMGAEDILVGFEDKDTSASKDIEIESSIYSHVKAVWVDAATVEKDELGDAAREMFRTPTNYYEHIYVVLGATYKEQNIYAKGDIINLRTEYGPVEVAVIGFLDKGKTVVIDNKKITLDNYMICPLLDMSDLYGEAKRSDSTYIEPMYAAKLAIGEEQKALTKSGEEMTITEGDVTYIAGKAIWFDNSLREDPTVDENLKTVLATNHAQGRYFVVLGSNYRKNGVAMGASFNFMFSGTKQVATCVGTFPEGTTYQVNGETIVLDDYIGLMQVDYDMVYFPEEEVPDTNTTKPAEEEDETQTAEEEVVAQGNTVTYSLAERNKLFHVLFMKNRSYFTTTLTPNESQRKLSDMVERCWKDYKIENDNADSATNYWVREADATNSILFRSDIEKIQSEITKVAYLSFFIGGLFLLLYYFIKRRSAREYFVTLLITGGSNFEIMLLFFVEAVLMYILTVGFGFAISFVLSKLLSLTILSYKNLLGLAAAAIFVPCLIIMLRVLFTDYGKMFRRGK